MASYKIVNADQLDADLTAVADSIRAKGETTGELAFPAGFQEAVASIVTGVDVKIDSGRKLTLSNGSATVNCGFVPDVVIITGFSYEGTQIQMGFCFPAASGTGNKYMTAYNDTYDLIECIVAQTTNGFKVSSFIGYTESSEKKLTGSYNYVAVKYTA